MHTLRLSAILLAVVSLGPTIARAQPLPWQAWQDLARLPVLEPGAQVLLRSSHCLWGCRFDRHADGDWRYIRVEGEEGVIFEETGPGAIARIWMTTGSAGQGTALPADVRMRVYLDGGPVPVLDLPLRSYFDGSEPPFLPPLVGNHLQSSGGNYSYVPIAYREGCRITLVGADETLLWYQITHHRLAEPGSIVSFTGTEDLTAWSALLSAAGDDPWLLGPGLPPTAGALAGQVILGPGDEVTLAALDGPDLVTALRLDLPGDAQWEVELVMSFDGVETVRLPLADFFGLGRPGTNSIRSLLVGQSENDRLYSYFPLPFATDARFALRHVGASADLFAVSWELRTTGEAPPVGSLPFGARLLVDPETPIGADIPLLELDGRGKWVGLVAELSSVATTSREYLEGDERLFVDGSRHPSVYGTGVEDLFNAGFYFDQVPFGLALHGAPYHLEGPEEDVTAAYRLMLSDPIPFTHRLRLGLEGGPTGNLALRTRAVSYYYHDAEPRLWPWDRLVLGEESSRARHGYEVDGPYELLELSSTFEGEPPAPWTGTGVYRILGAASFSLEVPEGAQRLRLRRRLDADLAGQTAEVCVGGEQVARLPPVPPNPDRRWLEVDIDLPPGSVPPSGLLDLEIVPTGDDVFSSFLWELWADVDPTLFRDGFESGDLDRWGGS